MGAEYGTGADLDVEAGADAGPVVEADAGSKPGSRYRCGIEGRHRYLTTDFYADWSCRVRFALCWQSKNAELEYVYGPSCALITAARAKGSLEVGVAITLAAKVTSTVGRAAMTRV